MVQCFVPDCKHRSGKEKCKFYRFPSDATARHRWMRYIRRADKAPTVHSRVCSCHFPDGPASYPVLFSRRLKTKQSLVENQAVRITLQEHGSRCPQPIEQNSEPNCSNTQEHNMDKETKQNCSNTQEHSIDKDTVENCSNTQEHSIDKDTVENCSNTQEHSMEKDTVENCSNTQEHSMEKDTVENCSNTQEHSIDKDTVENCSNTQEHSMDKDTVENCSNTQEHSMDKDTVENCSNTQEHSMKKDMGQNCSNTQEQDVLENPLVRSGLSASRYTALALDEKVLRMETGFPDKIVFNIFVEYTKRFRDSIVYYYNWNVDCLPLEDQILMTLMKLRHNYTHLHLAQLFQCSSACVSNVVLTFIYVAHELWFTNIMSTVPSCEKNLRSLPSSFQAFPNCRMVIDCTDIKIAAPAAMDLQKYTYSPYRGMHTFKVLIGVAPNAVITYCSKLYPGSVSDKNIVAHCGILDIFKPGDTILADKGFLISDILPQGVNLNIPPFLHHGTLTEAEIKQTKAIARARIHVERANARLKDYKILQNIPHSLRIHASVIVQLCCALVNLQSPLIKEVDVNLSGGPS